jgi:hypothetical protein
VTKSDVTMGKNKVDKTTLSLIKPSVVSMVVTHAERKTERPAFITFHAEIVVKCKS